MNLDVSVTIISGGFAGRNGVVRKVRNSVDDGSCICTECEQWFDVYVIEPDEDDWTGSFCPFEVEVQAWNDFRIFEITQDRETGYYVVTNTRTGEKVGNSQTEAAARIIRRKAYDKLTKEF